MILKVSTHELLWVVQRAQPRLSCDYDPADYQRRLRRIAQLERHEMPVVWGADEPHLFDALVRARDTIVEQHRAREHERAQAEVNAIEAKLRTAESRAERARLDAQRKPEKRIHELKANVRIAQIDLYKEELRIATERMQALSATEVVLLWTT